MKLTELIEASETIHKHKLWVDDMRNPPEKDEESYDVARSYDEAIQMLKTHKYTDIYLDHDLGDFTGPNNHERTGYDIILFLVDRKNNGKYVPINFHMLTSNPVGKNNMEAVINRYLRS
jgi:hypothetical protein